MPAFLDTVASHIHARFGDQSDQIAIVLPSRRAAVFMREALAKAYGKTLWSPYIAAIQDFVREQDGASFPENLGLLFQLYQVYRNRMLKIDGAWHEPFERFYPWGEMLLRDFDEVDKYLVDAQQLFTNVSDLKEVELAFGLSEEDREAVARFWNAVLIPEDEKGEDKKVGRERFLYIWGVLRDVYEEFQASLRAKHQAYDGMAYRAIADAAKTGSLDVPYQHIYFAGFNALSKAEEVVMGYLLEKEQATVFWDVDEHFLGNDTPIGEEAGYFIRAQHAKWAGKDSILVRHDTAQQPKEIRLLGAPLSTGQAQYAGNILRDMKLTEKDARKTALVLADEQLLFPLLHALPASIERLNITMGFPLKQTSIHHVLQATLRLVQSQEYDEGGQVQFPYTAVFDLLSNSYLQAALEDKIQDWKNHIAKQNMVLVPAHYFQKNASSNPLGSLFFTTPKYKDDLIPWLEQVFSLLLEDAQEKEANLEAEYAFQLFTKLNQLKTALLDIDAPLTLYGLAAILSESFKRARIPFEGEPLEGLQLMGFLETRTLDFKRVIMLGVNEGKLPTTSAGNSFIPYHLRRGFGMPTFEQKDAIFAYHFFRSIMRAEDVTILYNNQPSDVGGSKEMSRYLYQIRHFGNAFPAWKVIEQQVGIAAPHSIQKDISIPATAETRDIIKGKYIDSSPKQQALSPTALTTYLRCPLRFYFRYVAGLKEQETLAESMEANTFGSILHATLEYIYEEHLGQKLNPDTITNTLKRKVPQMLAKAFLEEAKLNWSELRGRNFLMKDVLLDRCEKVLEQDALLEPFTVQGLEVRKAATIPSPDGPVRISGILDRVDEEAEGVWRIVDYKTGKLTFPTKSHTLEDVFTKSFENSYAQGLKEAFQGFLYSWLLLKDQPNAKVKTGFYVVKTASQGILYLADGEALTVDNFVEMENYLAALVQKILYEPFTQTENEQQCTSCPYNAMCRR
ncbi:MAG: PD-(D/E)XK nuclease family protein [Bacteroidia bacterium]